MEESSDSLIYDTDMPPNYESETRSGHVCSRSVNKKVSKVALISDKDMPPDECRPVVGKVLFGPLNKRTLKRARTAQ